MRKSIISTVLCALWIVASTTSPTMSQAATITVLHGMKSEIFDTAKVPPGGVHIARPAITPKSKPSPVAANRPRAAKSLFAAGKTLWSRNARGRLVACRVQSSGMVGRDVIRCTSARRIRR